MSAGHDSEQDEAEGPQISLGSVDGVVWEDDDGQLYKRVWDDRPKDVPVASTRGI